MGRFSVRDIFRNRNAEDNSVPDTSDSRNSGGEEDTRLIDPYSDMPNESPSEDVAEDGADPMNEGGLEDGVADLGDPKSSVMTPTYPSTLGEGTFSLPGSKTFRQYQQKRTSSPTRNASSIAGDDMITKRLKGIR